MAAGAADAQRGDARGDARGPGGRPGFGGRGDPEAEVGQGDVGVGADVVQARDQGAVVHAQCGLDQTGDARGAFQVADVGLHGADHQRQGAPGAGPVRLGEARRLDRVPDAGAGAVQFDVLDLGGVHPRTGQGLAGRAGLGGGARDGEAAGAGAGAEGAALDDGVHAVAVGDGALVRLEDDQTAALAADVSVGALVEDVAGGVGRKGSGGLDHRGAERADDEVDATRERGVRLAAVQALAGEVDGDEGGGLARVHGHAGPVQAQRVRDAVGDHRAAGAREGVAGDVAVVAPGHEIGVVGGHDAEEDADPSCSVRRGPGFAVARVPGRAGGDPGVLQPLPGEFEGEALLRVGVRGLSGGHPEELGVELLYAVDESASGRTVRALGSAVADGVAAFGQQTPELVRPRCVGQPGGDAHDRRPMPICARHMCFPRCCSALAGRRGGG